MKLWRKVGKGFKSNILILITVALWHKVTRSADALAHFISFMSWRIWISQDARVKQKVISASFANQNLVESKLNCQYCDYLPLGITENTHDNCLVQWGIHRLNFLLKPNVDKILWIRTISTGENWREVWIRHCQRVPQYEHFCRSRPPQCFYVSRLVRGYYPLLTDAFILPR